MAKGLVSDNATTTLAVGLGSGATSGAVAGGTGALFPAPNPTSGTYFFATLVKASDSTVREIVKVTNRVTDTMTFTPTTTTWSAGDFFNLLDTAELLALMVQFDDLQAQAPNYAIDTGSANTYVVTLTPALAAPISGTPIRWLAGHANTGASTFNGVALRRPDGAALLANDVLANGIYTSIWNPSFLSGSGAYQLEGILLDNFNQLVGSIASSQVPSGAVTQYAAAILANAALTGTPVTPTAAPGTNNTQVASTAFANAAAVAAATSLLTKLLQPNGYINIGGFVLQWGSFSSSGGSQPISFGQEFPNTCVNALFTPPVSGYTAALINASAAGMTVDTTKLGGGLLVRYLAYGY